jgi:putative CocE/NonD family hydrolase
MTAAFQGLELGAPEPRHAFTLDTDVEVPLRDGAQLAADLYLPIGAPAQLGTVLIRTPYDRRTWRPDGNPKDWEQAELFVRQGFALVIQDVRGKWGSESAGDYHFYRSDRDDGCDTLDWIVAQPWSNGRVGTYGCSSLGETQLLLATRRHPAHAAAIPQGGAACAAAEFGARTGGALDLLDTVAWFSGHGARDLSRGEPTIDVAQAVWTLPVIDAISVAGGPASDFEELVASVPYDAWWNETVGRIVEDERLDVPALFVDSWFDRLRALLPFVERLRRESVSERARRNQFVVVAPCSHCAMHGASEQAHVGELHVGDARFPLYALYVRWFRHWLEDPAPGDFDWPPFTSYAIGGEGWRSADAWPPPDGGRVELSLASDGSAAVPSGAGRLDAEPPRADAVDGWVYDPADPCPTHGGRSFYPGVGLAGVVDQRPLQQRADVATYLGAELEEPLDLEGAPELRLHFSSSAPDTDVVAKLLDVLPDGRLLSVSETILRLRYRDGFDAPALLEPGTVYELLVQLDPLSYRFAAGHRIGLLLTSSDFPAHDRNLNVADPPAFAATPALARNSVHHGPTRPSRLLLPTA